MRILKRPVDAVLAAIFLLSIVAVLLGSEDPFFRNALFRRASFPERPHLQSWLKLLYDLGVGSLVSLFFYWLVVRIPEREKRNRIKRSFANHYREFKEDCIQVMLTVADGSWVPRDASRSQEVQSLFRAKSNFVSRPMGRLS